MNKKQIMLLADEDLVEAFLAAISAKEKDLLKKELQRRLKNGSVARAWLKKFQDMAGEMEKSEFSHEQKE